MEYNSIGKNIAKRRKKLGYTQEKLAEKAGLSVSFIGALERGEKLPSLPTFIDIANILEISSDILLSDVLVVGNEIVASELYKQIENLPKNEQRRILNVVHVMISNI